MDPYLSQLLDRLESELFKVADSTGRWKPELLVHAATVKALRKRDRDIEAGVHALAASILGMFGGMGSINDSYGDEVTDLWSLANEAGHYKLPSIDGARLKGTFEIFEVGAIVKTLPGVRFIEGGKQSEGGSRESEFYVVAGHAAPDASDLPIYFVRQGRSYLRARHDALVSASANEANMNTGPNAADAELSKTDLMQLSQFATALIVKGDSTDQLIPVESDTRVGLLQKIILGVLGLSLAWALLIQPLGAKFGWW